jgi:hypothetical protein
MLPLSSAISPWGAEVNTERYYAYSLSTTGVVTEVIEPRLVDTASETAEMGLGRRSSPIVNAIGGNKG